MQLKLSSILKNTAEVQVHGLWIMVLYYMNQTFSPKIQKETSSPGSMPESVETAL